MQVTGIVSDSSDQACYILSGTWDEKMEGAKVAGKEESAKGKVVYETKESFVLWQRRYPP